MRLREEREREREEEEESIGEICCCKSFFISMGKIGCCCLSLFMIGKHNSLVSIGASLGGSSSSSLHVIGKLQHKYKHKNNQKFCSFFSDRRKNDYLFFFSEAVNFFWSE